MRKTNIVVICAAVAALALVLGVADFTAQAEKPTKLVVRQFCGPFGVEPGQTVRLAAFNLLPNAGGRLTLGLLDASTGQAFDGQEFLVDPRTGENFTITVSNPGVTMLLGVVGFESGDVAAVRGPVLAASLEVFDSGFGRDSFLCTGEAF